MSRGRFSSSTSREDCAQPPRCPTPPLTLGVVCAREARHNQQTSRRSLVTRPSLFQRWLVLSSVFVLIAIEFGRVTWFCLWSVDQWPVVRKEADSFAPDPSHRLGFPRQQSGARYTKPEPLDLRGAFRAPFSPLGGPTTGLIIVGSTRRSKFKTNTHIAKQTTLD